MESFDEFVNRYIALESRIRSHMIALFSEPCGLCTACCCRADICDEVVQSAFLSRLLEKQGRLPDDMDDRFGWLELHGCSLEYGRPPVCYSFFCDELLARLPDEDTRRVVRVLGRLPDYVGENAVGEWHLAEVADPSALDSLDLPALFRRLDKAESVLAVIEAFMETGRLGQEDRAVLAAIPLKNR
jgi:hypothetical protein